MSITRRPRVVQGSCWSCRKRRIKCDLERPKCARCNDLMQECSYNNTPPIKWVGGMATRGSLASLSPQDVTHQSVLLPSISPKLDEEEFLLYFSKGVLPRFQLSNIYIELDLGSIHQNQSLQHAILAVSRAHFGLTFKCGTPDKELLKKRARQGAIESFRKRLETGETSESAAQHLFTITVLLCMLDGIIEPSEPFSAPICHLRGGFAMLEHWPSTITQMLVQDGMQSHMLSIFATIDLVHAMLVGEKPFLDSSIWPMFARTQTWWGRLPVEDRFLGILKAFSDMASLGYLIRSTLPATDACALVDKCLPGIQSALYTKAERTPSLFQHDLADAKDWDTFCTIYEICGTIFMRRALQLRPIDHETVQQAARKGVEKLIDEKLPGMLEHCLILPLLVIGSHCIHTQDRRAVLEVLSPSVSFLSFGSLQLMTEFLEKTWSSSNMETTWWDCFAEVSERVFLF